MKNIVDQILIDYQNDNIKKKQAVSTSVKTFTINTTLALGTCFIYLILHYFKTPYEFADILIAGIIWDIIGSFICLIMVSGGVGRYYDSIGIRRYPKICVFLNMISLLDIFLIFTWGLVAFKYNPDTDTLEMSFGKLLIISPVIFVIMIILSLLKGHPISYTPDSYYVNTYNNELIEYGINPNKIPYDIKTEYYQKLGEDEWKEIGLIVKQFGYDIFGG